MLNKMSRCNRIYFEKVIVGQMVRDFMRFVETLSLHDHVENSLPLECNLSHFSPVCILLTLLLEAYIELYIFQVYD
jgi:hypothetical protein